MTRPSNLAGYENRTLVRASFVLEYLNKNDLDP